MINQITMASGHQRKALSFAAISSTVSNLFGRMASVSAAAILSVGVVVASVIEAYIAMSALALAAMSIIMFIDREGGKK